MPKIIYWICPHCGVERCANDTLLRGHVCETLSCHFSQYRPYNLVLDMVKCLGCKHTKCIKALIYKEEVIREKRC